MTRSARRRFRRLALIGSVLSAFASTWVMLAPAGAFPNTPYPQIQLNHTLTTTPFAGSSASMRDDEGSAYVPRDDSLWLTDDDSRKIYEVNPVSGELKRTLGDSAFTSTVQYGGGPPAGTWRDRDLESISYDATNDVLYVFSGKCCTASVLPTIYRMTRDTLGTFQLDSYQPMPSGSDFTGSAWNPGDGVVYVGNGSDLRTYDYATNTMGAAFQVPKLRQITGMTFSPDGLDLYVTHALTKVSRVNWATKTLVSGWSFDLSSFGVQDARAVEIINDELWVSDGYDFRAAGDPLSHAVFVFDLTLPPPDFNIVGNPGFEQGTSGWNNNGTANVSLEQVTDGHSGVYSARLTNGGSSSATMTLNDSPNWVETSTAGTFTARAWVRSDTGTGKAYVRLREYQGSTLVVLATSVVTLSSTWQQMTVSLTAQAAGTSTLDLNVYVSGAPAGTNLYVDDVTLNIG
jgi:hypothetical protein